MMIQQQHATTDVPGFGIRLQKLVNHVGVKDGLLEMTVHEEKVVKVTLRPVITICLTHPRVMGREIVHTITVQVADLERHVQAELAELVLSRVGAFGSLEVNVDDGRVSCWQFCERHKARS